MYADPATLGLEIALSAFLNLVVHHGIRLELSFGKFFLIISQFVWRRYRIVKIA